MAFRAARGGRTNQKRAWSPRPFGRRSARTTPPPVSPVDATGADDCFNAGLLAGLLRGSDPPEALALGCATGAASTQGIGGTGSSPGLSAALALARNVSVQPWP
jgi:sugar/nucleoside kinase (ribokinase family)